MLIVNADEVVKKTNIKCYNCDSMPLYDYLTENNHVPIRSKISYSGHFYYVFIVTDTLSNLLTRWSSNKEIRNKYYEKRKK